MNRSLKVYLCGAVDAVPGNHKRNSNLNIFKILIFAVIFLTGLNCLADSKRFSAKVNSPEQLSKDLSSFYSGENKSLELSTELFQHGRLIINLAKNQTIDNSDLKTLEGTISTISKKKNRKARREYKLASASIFSEGNKIKLEIFFNFQTRNNHTRFYKFGYLAGDKKAHITTAPQFALYGKSCGDGHESSALEAGSFETESSETREFETRAATYKEVEISTDTDCQASSLYGVGASARIAGFVNTASVIYQNNLGLKLKINFQRNQTNCGALSSTDSGDLLVAYRALANTNGYQNTSDANFLFTGKDIDSNVIGLAYLGTVCSAPTYAYGLVQHVNDSLNHVIFAHELGHSFNAEHTNSGIMTAALGGTPPTSFNSTSISQIGSYLSTEDTCLALVDDSAPPPPPTSTPDPGSTATPVPTPTDDADPDGGGGNNNGGGGDGDFTPQIYFKGSISGQTFKGKVKLEQYIDGCSVTFKASSKPTNLQNGRLIDEVLPISANTLMKAKFKRKLKSGRYIYFVAMHNCEGSPSTISQPVKVDTFKLRLNQSATFSGVINSTSFSYFGL